MCLCVFCLFASPYLANPIDYYYYYTDTGNVQEFIQAIWRALVIQRILPQRTISTASSISCLLLSIFPGKFSKSISIYRALCTNFRNQHTKMNEKFHLNGSSLATRVWINQDTLFVVWSFYGMTIINIYE